MSSETGINGQWYPTSIFLQRRATQGKASLTQSFQCVLRGHYRLKSQGKRPRLHTAEVYLIELAGQVDPEGERDPGEKRARQTGTFRKSHVTRIADVLSMSYVKAASIQRNFARLRHLSRKHFITVMCITFFPASLTP